METNDQQHGTHTAQSVPEAFQWQPIETAPKDTPVLMWCERDGVGIGEVRVSRNYRHEWIDEETMKRIFTGNSESVDGLSATGICMFNVTHWMPLPAPPE